MEATETTMMMKMMKMIKFFVMHAKEQAFAKFVMDQESLAIGIADFVDIGMEHAPSVQEKVITNNLIIL